MNEQYKQLGVSDAVLTYGETILAALRERFDAIDAIAENTHHVRIPVSIHHGTGSKGTLAPSRCRHSE